jgi:hypothetical protein
MEVVVVKVHDGYEFILELSFSGSLSYPGFKKA